MQALVGLATFVDYLPGVLDQRMARVFGDELLRGCKNFFNVDVVGFLQHAGMVVLRNGSLRDAYLAPEATRIKNR